LLNGCPSRNSPQAALLPVPQHMFRNTGANDDDLSCIRGCVLCLTMPASRRPKTTHNGAEDTRY